MISFFHTILYVPIYNLLIFFVDIVPGGDVGIAVIIVTAIVKVVLWPLSIMAIKTQRRMKFLEPQLREIREKYKDNKEKQALETLSLYKNNGVRPFASVLVTLLQLPVIISLYLVFRHEHLLAPNQALIYHFVTFPTHISPVFLGIFPTTGHVLVLAAIAGIAQFAQAYITIPVPPKTKNSTSSEDFARAISLQSRLILPVLIAVLAYTAGALAIYFITSSIVGILQEYYVRWRLRYLKMPEAS
jgi:YidC/Oxa1 family membrane protein insertase